MLVYFSLLVAIIGVVMFAIAANPKVVRIGEILFFCGTLVFLFDFPHIVSVLR